MLDAEILFDEEPHTYTYRGQLYPSVTQVIRNASLGQDFSMVSEQKMEIARRRGSMVHLACQYFDEGVLDVATVHESILGYVNAYRTFRSHRPMVLSAIEQRLVAILPAAPKSGDQDQYLAGTPDRIVLIDGIRAVVDLKTSSSMGRSMGVQTAGYQRLWNFVNPTKPVHERYGLKLEKTGKYKLIAHRDPDDHLAFRDALFSWEDERKMDRWRQKYAAA